MNNQKTRLTIIAILALGLTAVVSRAGFPVARSIAAAAQDNHPPTSVLGRVQKGENKEPDLPRAGMWIAAASIPTAVCRYGFVGNGEDFYLISGATNGSVTNVFRRYNALSDRWTSLKDVPVGSEAPSAAIFNGKIYVADGNAGAGNSFRIYDIATDTWSTGASVPGLPNRYGSAAGAFNGNVYVVGASDSSGAGSTDARVYDIGTGTWSESAAAPFPYGLGGYTQVGQFLYMVGSFQGPGGVNSNVTMRLDMATGTWSTGPQWTPRRADFALVSNGFKLFAIGGDADGGTLFDATTNVDELDLSAWPDGTWVASPNPLPSPRQANQAGYFSTGRAGGEIWSTGGYVSGTFLSEYLFSPQAPCLLETFDIPPIPPTLPPGWTATLAQGVQPPDLPWRVVTTPVADSLPNSAFAAGPNHVSDNRLDTPVFFPPLGARISARQNWNLENSFDGAVLEISIGGGAFTDIITAGGTFCQNGYNATINTLFGSPIGGRRAWSGNSGGYVTMIVLLPAQVAGQGVRLRWRLATDSSVSSVGFNLDTVMCTGCPDCPADITVSNTPNLCGSSVSYTIPTPTTCCPGTVTCSPPPGSFFPVGMTTVTCTTSSGNSCTFKITVVDTQPPFIACPPNITTNTAPNLCTKVVSWSLPPARDNCRSVMVSCTPPPGTTFQKGVTVVTCTAKDASNNVSSCTFTVTVIDTQPPLIGSPPNITANTAPNLCTAAVSYPLPAAADNCPMIRETCTPPSGTAFPKGVTVVTCTAIDMSGNMASSSFLVTVNDLQPPTIINCPPNQTALTPTPKATKAVVNYPLPTASDNCPMVTVFCSPPPGLFPLGMTTVTCKATDMSGNMKFCAFKVFVFNVCIEEPGNPSNVVLLDTFTGFYVYCCNGNVITGKVSVPGPVYIEVIPGRKVTITQIGTSWKAKIEVPGTGISLVICPITDTNITNNTCNCRVP